MNNWNYSKLLSKENIVTDEFLPFNESEVLYKYTDYSSLKDTKFNESKTLDFLSDSKNIKKSYNGDSPTLGVFEGVFFLPDGISNNKRIYRKALWDNVLKDPQVARSLYAGMIGTYEHPTEFEFHTEDGLPTTAHPKYLGIVTKELGYKTINGKLVGWGKSYIMNTEIGNIINVMLKAKDEEGKALTHLGISSRAYALPETKYVNGVKVEVKENNNLVINPQAYLLLAFDVVALPGFNEAIPTYRPIVESLINDYLSKSPELNKITESESLKLAKIKTKLNELDSYLSPSKKDELRSIPVVNHLNMDYYRLKNKILLDKLDELDTTDSPTTGITKRMIARQLNLKNIKGY